MRPDVKAFKARQAEMGKAAELPRDVVPFGEARVQRLAGINARRVASGRPPLVNDEEGHPELTEQRRRRSEEFQHEQSQAIRAHQERQS
jgi:hypothetical protein